MGEVSASDRQADTAEELPNSQANLIPLLLTRLIIPKHRPQEVGQDHAERHEI